MRTSSRTSVRHDYQNVRGAVRVVGINGRRVLQMSLRCENNASSFIKVKLLLTNVHSTRPLAPL